MDKPVIIMDRTVKLIENFVTWQGEGPDSGKSMIILRFKTCNLKCPWCDTSVKMRITAESEHRMVDIQKTIEKKSCGILITGGEPTVDRHYNDTLSLLNGLLYPIANVESNGYNLYKLITETIPSKNVNFIYSPKIFSKEDMEEALKMTDLIYLHKNVHIKIVWDGGGLIENFIEKIFLAYPNLNWEQRIWLMPEGVTKKELLSNAPEVFDICEKYNLNFSSRNHIMFGFV